MHDIRKKEKHIQAGRVVPKSGFSFGNYQSKLVPNERGPSRFFAQIQYSLRDMQHITSLLLRNTLRDVLDTKGRHVLIKYFTWYGVS